MPHFERRRRRLGTCQEKHFRRRQIDRLDRHLLRMEEGRNLPLCPDSILAPFFLSLSLSLCLPFPLEHSAKLSIHKLNLDEAADLLAAPFRNFRSGPPRRARRRGEGARAAPAAATNKSAVVSVVQERIIKQVLS